MRSETVGVDLAQITSPQWPPSRLEQESRGADRAETLPRSPLFVQHTRHPLPVPFSKRSCSPAASPSSTRSHAPHPSRGTRHGPLSSLRKVSFHPLFWVSIRQSSALYYAPFYDAKPSDTVRPPAYNLHITSTFSLDSRRPLTLSFGLLQKISSMVSIILVVSLLAAAVLYTVALARRKRALFKGLVTFRSTRQAQPKTNGPIPAATSRP